MTLTLLRIPSLLILCLLISMDAFSQPQSVEPRDSLRPLKRAIAESGATALVADQEAQINALVAAFRSVAIPGPDEAREAQAEYAAAILAGSLEAAQAQAAVLAGLSATRLQAAAKVQIDIIGVLKPGGQLDALKAKLGDGLVPLLGSLVGSPPPGVGGPGGRPGQRPGFEPGIGPRGPRGNPSNQ
ncbi:MAG: hypothetical protein ABI882_18420 [Acidobacteriota bacterium]